MVTVAMNPIQPSSSMEYISESTDICNNSDRLQEISGINSKSDQSELVPGSITDDCKISKLIVCHSIFVLFSQKTTSKV